MGLPTATWMSSHRVSWLFPEKWSKKEVKAVMSFMILPQKSHIITVIFYWLLRSDLFKVGGELQKSMSIRKQGFPGGSVVKNPSANAGDVGTIPESGRSSREGNGNPLQYSCLRNPKDRGLWWATVHGGGKRTGQKLVTKQLQLKHLCSSSHHLENFLSLDSFLEGILRMDLEVSGLRGVL